MKDPFTRNARGTTNRLKDSKVLILGLGGIGSNTAIGLARSGVGILLLVDFDRVELSNLNRQQYRVDQLGEKKTIALAENIEAMGLGTELEIYNLRVGPAEIEKLAKQADLVCECFDKAETKAMAAETVLSMGKPLIASSGMAGVGTCNCIETANPVAGLYVCGDRERDYECIDGMMAAGTMICAGHQIDTAVCLLSGIALKERKGGKDGR